MSIYHSNRGIAGPYLLREYADSTIEHVDVPIGSKNPSGRTKFVKCPKLQVKQTAEQNTGSQQLSPKSKGHAESKSFVKLKCKFGNRICLN